MAVDWEELYRLALRPIDVAGMMAAVQAASDEYNRTHERDKMSELVFFQPAPNVLGVRIGRITGYDFGTREAKVRTAEATHSVGIDRIRRVT